MDRRNGGMASYLTSEGSPNLTGSQFNEDIGYTSTQRHDLQIQFNEDIGYTSTQRELRPAAIHTCLKMNKKLNTYSRSGSIEDIFNAPTQEFIPPDDDNEVEIINEAKSIKKHSNVSTPNLAPPPPLQTRTISEVEINKSKYIEDVTTTSISGLTSLNKVEIVENQPGNRKDILTPMIGPKLPQKFQNQSINEDKTNVYDDLDVSDSSEYEHQQLYVTSTTPPNSSSMHLPESEHQTIIKRRTKSRTNRRHSDSTSGLNQSSCSPLKSSQSTNLTSESSHSSHSRARLNSGSTSECRSNNSNSLLPLLTRDSRSRSSSRHASPSLLECVPHSKSGSNHDSRSRSRSITSSISKHDSDDRSRLKHSSRSRARAKHGSRDQSRSKHNSRSRSRAKHGSRDRSRLKHSSCSRSRTKHGSCSHSRSKSKSNHRCYCRSGVNHGSRSKSRSKHVYDHDSCHDSSSRSFNQQASAPSRHRNQSDSIATATSNGQSSLAVPHTDVSASIFHSHKDATYMKNLFKSAAKFQEKVLYYKKATLEIEVKEQKAIEDLNGSTRKLQQIQEELANLKHKSLKYLSMDSFCENISNYVDVRGCLVNEMSPPPPPLPPTPESEKLPVPQSALSPPLSPPTPTTTSENLPIHSQPVTGFAESNNMPTLLLPQNPQTTVHRKIEPNVSHGEMPRRMLPSVSPKKVTMKLVKPHALPPSSVSVSVSTPTSTSEDLPIHSQPVTGFAESNNMPTLLLPQSTQTTVHRKIEPEPNVSYDETPRRMLPSVTTKKVKLHTLYPSNVSVSVPTPTTQPKQRVEPVTLIKQFTDNKPQWQAANVAEGCISSKSRLSAKSSNPILPKSLIDVMANVVAANVGFQKKRKKPLLDTTIAKKRRAKYQLNKVLKEKSASQIDGITNDILLKEINNYKPHN